MMLARGTTEKGKELLILGLSIKNVERLLQNKPMHIRREHHGEGVPEGWEILIVVGKDEETLYQQFRENSIIGQNTMVIKTDKLNNT